MIHYMHEGVMHDVENTFPGPIISDSGPPAPTGGRCTLEKVPDHDPAVWHTLILKRADPCILVLNEILFGLHRHRWQYHPHITLTRPITGHGSPGHFDINYGKGPRSDCEDCHTRLGMVCFKDSLLRIQAQNQTAVYRIGNYLHGPKSWEACWVD